MTSLTNSFLLETAGMVAEQQAFPGVARGCTLVVYSCRKRRRPDVGQQVHSPTLRTPLPGLHVNLTTRSALDMSATLVLQDSIAVLLLIAAA